MNKRTQALASRQEEASALWLRAAERRVWDETGFDASSWVLLAIGERLSGQPGWCGRLDVDVDAVAGRRG